MSLQIDALTGNQNRVTVFLNGSLDTNTSPQFEEFLKREVDKSVKYLAIDLKDLHYVSSAGLRAFALARREFAHREGKVVFANPSPQVAKVFEIVKAIPIKEVFSSSEELDAYLDKIQTGVSS
ncbi:MAG: STAS domain-containing protein [Verrucomicrobiota bacterium]